MKLSYLEKPYFIPLAYLLDKQSVRTFITTDDLEVELSDGRTILIPVGYETDLSSIPSWLWNVLRPFDNGLMGDIIHDYLWTNKVEEIQVFDGNVYESKKFSDYERMRWRNAHAPNKRTKTKLTTWFLRRSFVMKFYTREKQNTSVKY